MTVRLPNCTTYDVRRLAPAKQQAAVLSMFDDLRPGHTFTFVCDFDPGRLKRKFSAFFDGEHTWTCVQQGPPEWKIEVGKRGRMERW
jgi:uncharacterized protein (DUF2249 family)